MVTFQQRTKDILILTIAFFAARLPWLTAYPVFNDESTYLRYGQIMTSVPNQLWYSLVHSGKQPLPYWLYGLSMQYIHDPLLAGRVASVIIASFGPIGMYIAARRLRSRRAGLIAGFLWIVSPLSFFFDRLALVDSMLAVLFAWIIALCLYMYRARRIRYAIIIGVLVATSLWIKSTGFIFALFVAVFFFRRRYIDAFLVCCCTIALMFAPLYIRPEYSRVLEMATDYSYSIVDLFFYGFRHTPKNILDTFLVYGGYVSPIVLIAAFKNKYRIIQLAWILPLLILLVFGKSLHGRYLLFTTIPLLLASSVLLEHKKKLLIVSGGLMICLSVIAAVYPAHFFHLYPSFGVFASERNQYVDGWSSGYGVRDALLAVKQDAQGKDAIIAVRWDTGNPEDAMFVFGRSESGITVQYLDKRLQKEAQQISAQASGMPVYYVTRKGQYGGYERMLQPWTKFAKPYGNEAVEVLRFTP